jgi:hypothetical protein
MRNSPASPYTEFLTAIYRLPPKRTGTFCLGVGLFLALVLCVAVPAKSALVSGQVYDKDGNVVRNTTFILQDGGRKPLGKEFATDGSGTYGVYLDPGLYYVQPQNHSELEGEIRSYPQPVHQDIHLHSKRK